MPFGAIYAALLFSAMFVWLVAGDPVLAPLPRACAAALAAVLAIALLARARWARWAAVVCSVAAVVGAFAAAGRADSPAPLAFGLGAVLAVPLLGLPATGRIRPARGRPALAAAAALAAVGGVAAFALTTAPPARTAPGTGAAGPLTAPLTAPSSARGSVPGAPGAPAAAPQWSGWTAALERASAEDRPVFVAFVTSWCGYCRKMEQVTWRDPGAIARLGRFVPVKIDAEDTRARDGVSGADLARRYGVAGYPTMLVVDAHGQVLSRAGGYLSPPQFTRWLDDALEQFGAAAGAPMRAAGSAS